VFPVARRTSPCITTKRKKQQSNVRRKQKRAAKNPNRSARRRLNASMQEGSERASKSGKHGIASGEEM